MNNFLYAFLISLMAGLSTLVGCLFIFIKVKNINKFLSISLSFSASVMILISILDLIPESFFSLYFNFKFFGILIAIISFIFGVLLINISNKFIKKQEEKGSSLYKLGILSAIVLIMHNIPEGIITFLTSGNDLELGIKIAIAINKNPPSILPTPSYLSITAPTNAVNTIPVISEIISLLAEYLARFDGST